MHKQKEYIIKILTSQKSLSPTKSRKESIDVAIKRINGIEFLYTSSETELEKELRLKREAKEQEEHDMHDWVDNR